MKEHVAKLSYLHMAPRKVRLLANLIKGMPVNRAEAQLLFNRRRPAGVLLKLLRSAIANAKAQKLSSDRLYVKSIQVNKGPMMKRSLPRARGMATPIQKKMSHITLVLAEGESKKDDFVIVRPKKTPKPTATPRTPKPKTALQEKTDGTSTPSKPSVLKRIFRRKSI
jgi:large subunit ribosomal protein L22